MKHTKKQYETAKIEVIPFLPADLMSASGEVPDESNMDNSWI